MSDSKDSDAAEPRVDAGQVYRMMAALARQNGYEREAGFREDTEWWERAVQGGAVAGRLGTVIEGILEREGFDLAEDPS